MDDPTPAVHSLKLPVGMDTNLARLMVRRHMADILQAGRVPEDTLVMVVIQAFHDNPDMKLKDVVLGVRSLVLGVVPDAVKEEPA